MESRSDAANGVPGQLLLVLSGVGEPGRAAKYAAYLGQAGYGQLRKPFDVSSFWLDGALTISAEQQVAFLKLVVQRSLPFSANAYETRRSIMLNDATPSYRLCAKIGWSTRGAGGLAGMSVVWRAPGTLGCAH